MSEMRGLALVVRGNPKTQGSMRAITNRHTGRAVILHDQGFDLKMWRSAILQEAVKQMEDRPPHRGPVSLHVTFTLARPKGHYGTGRNAARVKDSAPGWPTTKPDIDKLLRALMDALTGVAWADDSQVVAVTAVKKYGPPGMEAGVVFG